MVNKLVKYPPLIAAQLAVVSILLSRWLPILSFEFPGQIGVSWLILPIGFAIILWASVAFRAHKTPIMPNKKPEHLLTRGPFGFSRNPIYLGMALILFALSIYLGTVVALLAPVFFVFLVTKVHILPEEKALKSSFGAEAEAYLATVRRWI